VSVSRATPTIVAPTAYPLAGSFVDFLLRARRERDAGVPAFEHTRGFGSGDRIALRGGLRVGRLPRPRRSGAHSW